MSLTGIKFPANQRLWAMYYDAKGKPKWAIASDPARIKWYLYKIENNQAKKIKAGKSPMEFEDYIGKI